MLEFMNLKMDGFGLGESGISIWYADGRLRYAYDRMPMDIRPHLIVKVPGSAAEEFLASLQKLHVYRWRGHYQAAKPANSPFPQDARWALIYKEAGKDPAQFGGMNAFPRAWSSLLNLVIGLVRETEAAHLNHIARMDIRFTQDREYENWNPIAMEMEKEILRYSENLSLDRGEMRLRYIQRINGEATVTHEYKVPDIIDYLLGNCERYFRDFKNKDYARPERGRPQIYVNIQYIDGKKQAFSRSYDRHGVPDDWDEMLEDIHNTIAFYGLLGPIFDAGLYQHGVKEGEYIYLSCVSEPNGNKRFYRTTDDSLEIGDLVLVPSEETEGQARIVMIADIRYFTREQVPRPLEETSFVIRKFPGYFEGAGEDGAGEEDAEEGSGDGEEEDDV